MVRFVLKFVLFFILLVIGFTSCGVYKQNIMLKVDEDSSYEEIVQSAEKNYIIQPGDQFEIYVYSNKGELIVDPNFQLRQDLGANSISQQLKVPMYMVDLKGCVVLPLVDSLKVEGYTKFQLDSLLSDKFSAFYVDAYVLSKIQNRRVVVLGATGGQVIPIENENMNLLEVLALAGGLENDAKAHNIRLLRGDLNNPKVEVIDLSTIEGMKKATLRIQPNDVIYVEPVRKVLTEGIRDIAPVITLLTSFVTLIVLITRTN